MRKIYVALLSLFSLLFTYSTSSAQPVSGYSFSASAGTYTPISGTASTATGDDGTQGNIPIGFTFQFGGVNYTHIAVTTNGHLKLGVAGVAITASFGGFSNTAFPATTDLPVIAPLWDDMNLTGGNIQYLLSGTAGSQVFTVQWTDNRWSGSGSGTAPTNSYQVHLFEGTNVVEFVYGTMNGSSAGSATIGLNAPSGFISVTPGSPATSSNSVANNVISAATFLTSGTIYTFTPGLPCSASPITVFPWSESFNNASIPNCWNNEYVVGTANWTFVTSNGNGSITPRTGARMAEFRTGSYGPTTRLVTPRLDLSSLTNPRVKFYYANVNWFGDIDELRVYYKTSAGGAWTQIGVDYTAEQTAWTEVTLTLPSPSNDYYIAFQATSQWARGLNLDDVTVEETPPCDPPTGLGSSAVTTTTATINWAASVSLPADGYEWEVRTSGAAGSGAAGLAASGSTAAGIIADNVTGLVANTQYSVYVRSVCATGSVYSSWSAAHVFRTLCNPIVSFPFTETFEDASLTRSCWQRQIVFGTYNWTYGAGVGNGGLFTAHGGAVNARFFGSGYGGEVALLVSPELDLSSPGMATNGVDLEFWMANPSWLGDINPFRVLYKSAPADPWTVLPGAVFSSPVNSWTKIEIENLPNISSTYYIAFEGTQLWGYGLGIDDVVIKEGPSCRKPRNVRALGVTPNSAEVYFDSPGNDFIVEYGAPGFTPGVDGNAGVGGTIVTGTSSPITINGLTTSTTYDIYIRRVCIPGADYSENVRGSATTLCDAVNIPYFQNFESAIIPAMPTCTSVEDVNGNSGSYWLGTGAGTWETYTDANPLTYVSPVTSLLYFYDFNDLTRPADDWFYLRGLNLTGGTTYRLKFFYKGLDGVNFPERLEVKYGLAASAANMSTGTIFNNSNVSSVYGSAFDSVRVDFTPPADGVYYIGFHAYSFADRFGILIDDVSVAEAPLLDVGISNIILPNLSCPVNNVFIQADIRNYDIYPVDFSVNPVNVNAQIVNGTTTTNLPPTLINSGVIPPNGTMGIYLGTAYNFVPGTHQITLNTTSPGDPVTANDTLRTTVVVNPVPAAPVITPAAPQVCLGNTVQLTVAATNAIATSTAATTGAISVAIPDGSAAGTTSSLAISGIPSTATITGVTVSVSLTHTWISDMVVNLRAPNGNVLNLFNRRGGSGDNLTNTVFSSASTTSLATGTPPYTGTFAADAATGVGPTGNAANVTTWSDLYSVGSGNWILSLRDYVGFDAGTLTGWSITINYSYFPAVTWSPVTELFTNAAATTPYVAGTNAYTLWAKPTTTRTYTATATGAGGCNASTNVTVTVNPNPVVTAAALPARICISDTLVPLTGIPAGGTWSGVGVSGNNLVPSTMAVGTFTLTYNYNNVFGCPGSATTTARVEDCPERIVLLRDNAVVLFPNPTDGGRFNIRINSVLYNRLGMRVYTNNGTLVRTQQFNGLVYGRVIPIDLSALPGGTYIVKFYYDEAGPRTADKSFKVIIGH